MTARDISGLRFVERLSLILGLMLFSASLFWAEKSIILGTFLGAALASLNLMALRRLAQALFIHVQEKKKRILMLTLLGAKMVVLIGLVYGVVVYFPVNAVAFAVGLSTMFISVMIGGLHISTKTLNLEKHG